MTLQEICDNAKKIPIILMGYVLRLECDKYYVGISSNINKRIGEHMTGNGSKWTKRYKLIEIISIEVVPSIYYIWENNKTLELMLEFGWKNVRGGSWTKVDMKSPPKLIRSRVYQGGPQGNWKGAPPV